MIPSLDLTRKYKEIGPEIEIALKRVLESGWYVLGKEGKSFEEEFSSYCGNSFGIGLGNGFDALHLTLRALDIGPGDEVITVPNTAIPTAAAITASGAKPIFVDVKDDFLIDPSKIESAITEKTRAIIPIHLFGECCDMDPIIELANRNKIHIIEDCAQAHGSTYNGKRVPISGIGCFSFYPTKNLGAFGDAGMVVTNYKELSEKLILLRQYGQSDKYSAEISGFNSRLDEIHASTLKVELSKLDKWINERRAIAKNYSEGLNNEVRIPTEKENTTHVYHQYVIQHDNRDSLKEKLNEKGIGTEIHYPIPLHLQKAYSNLGYKEGDFPNAERLSGRILSLPIYPGLSSEEIDTIIKEIKNIIYD